MIHSIARYVLVLACLNLPMLSGCTTTNKDAWKTVDEGFLMTVPVSWKRRNIQPIDSNAGEYRSRRAELNFDEWMDVDPPETAPSTIRNREKLKRLEAAKRNPRLLRPGEEVWTVDGRTTSFRVQEIKTGPRKEVRGFAHKAYFFVPYTDRPGYLSMTIYFKGTEDLPTVRKVLQSVRWKVRSR